MASHELGVALCMHLASADIQLHVSHIRGHLPHHETISLSSYPSLQFLLSEPVVSNSMTTMPSTYAMGKVCMVSTEFEVVNEFDTACCLIKNRNTRHGGKPSRRLVLWEMVS